MATQIQLQRLTRDWSQIAGENVVIEQIGSAYYGFCSELGALRLFKKYRYSGDKADAKFSPSGDSWFFRLEV